MSSPWPQIEQARQAVLNPRGLTFTYEQCTKCKRWFPSQRPIEAAPPTLCAWVCARVKRPAPRRKT